MTRNREILLVALSILIQIPLAVLLGHYYDQKIAMATGYLVSQGLSPYETSNFVGVFPHFLLNGIIPGIGYPPPWPLMLGGIFSSTYAVVPNIYFYYFMIKVPIIIANMALAYLIRGILQKTQTPKIANAAWLFVLFNPFVLLATTAWGSIESIVAFLSIASLYLASQGKIKTSAGLMALAVLFKPIALPLIGLPLFAAAAKKHSKKAEYLAVFSSVGLIGFFAPFYIFNWASPLAPGTWNSHFTMLGGLAPLNIVELFQAPVLPSGLDFLGFIWIPALLAGYFLVHRHPPESIGDFAAKGAALTLLFFVTRLWLSETNVTLVLALMLLTVTSNKSSFRDFHFLWIVPLIFMFLNWAIPQLFFLPLPTILVTLADVDQIIGVPRFLGKFAVALVWQALAWALIYKTLKPKSVNTN
ncbi:MAG TPA: hypothetical protein VLL96_02985 [Candidatus Deferrimicrobiaceae bacterium]|nr:hypothetical protein [Candidatus Deferrimicrobiaceae bacterium]